MHTLSLFPHLFDYQMLGIFLIRITLGLILLRFWYTQSLLGKHADRLHFFSSIGLRPAKMYFYLVSSIEGILGALLTVGMYVQGVAVITGVLMLTAAFFSRRKSSVASFSTPEFYILFALASFSLIFLGAGAFAVDMPL